MLTLHTTGGRSPLVSTVASPMRNSVCLLGNCAYAGWHILPDGVPQRHDITRDLEAAREEEDPAQCLW